MAKLEEDDDKIKAGEVEAHVTSLSVLRTHRKLGIATKLMRATHHQMKTYFGCSKCSLHVRVTNQAAIRLYSGILKYETRGVEKGYYADGEDGSDMVVYFNKDAKRHDESNDTTEESKAMENNQSQNVADHLAESNSNPGKKNKKNKKGN